MIALLEKWKEVLAGIAAVLVLILQIINVILSSDIEYNIATKADEMRRKADALQQLTQQTKTHLEQQKNDAAQQSPSPVH